MTKPKRISASTLAPLAVAAPRSKSAPLGAVSAHALMSEAILRRRREAALRASNEAAARRAEADARQRLVEAPIERAGRGGPDPVRYGDWEVKGIATDF
jgi:hypothetical protein